MSYMIKEVIEDVKKRTIIYLDSINGKGYMTMSRNTSNPVKNIKDRPGSTTKNLYTSHEALLYKKRLVSI